MLNNKKRVFWEALLLTLLIFLIGMLIGVLSENSRMRSVEEYYIQSEISLIDILTLSNLANLDDANCDNLINSNINFANRIYDEAKLLEKYEQAGKINENIKIEHKKYDVMRTLLWINTMRFSEVCKNNKVHIIVYLYESNTKDLTKKATNTVWSKIINDLKERQGNEIILIPIAVDSDLISLNSVLENFNISSYPALIIDDKYVLEELSSVEEIEEFF